MKHLALLCSFLLTIAAKAQFVIPDGLDENVYLNKGIYYLEDKDNNMTIEQVMKSEMQQVKNGSPNFGISPSAFWLRIDLKNNSSKKFFRLQVSQPQLDEIDFYHPEQGAFNVNKGGEVVPFRAREFFDPSYIYRVSAEPGQVTSLYFRVRSRDNLQIPIVFGPQETIFESNKIKDFIFGLFTGVMVVMFLYNAFLYVTIRDKTYLYYILYLATVILTQISIQGYTFQYLWPNSPFLARWSPFIWSPLVGIAAFYFMRVFLNTAYYIPKMDKGFKYFTIFYSIAFIFALIGRFDYSYLLISACAFLVSMYMLVGAVIINNKGYKPARFFLLAWSMFLVGVTVYSMTNFGILPTSTLTIYIMPFGAAAEVILLSLALADRINALKKEKEESQAEALKVSQQNQKLITEQNIVLEQKVHERTMELEETNEELNVTLTYLKDTQAQLVNAEKMASLGQLTAGIAHEINNPINFVSANLKPLKMDISELLDVVAKYETISPDVDLTDKLNEINDYKRKIDLDYLKKEISSLLNGIEDGARRTAEIVSGLKNFSRLDESDLKEANINEGIESTLVLIRSSVPKNVEIKTNLGELPMIECYPGKLNQVFMNLLTNAIYAMSKKDPDTQQTLTINTFERGNKVYAVFQDTGTGMSKEIKEKIFEPFFTTKDVGEGTGLGMSIVFKIMESHQAKMEIESEPGKGTTITMILNKVLAKNPVHV